MDLVELLQNIVQMVCRIADRINLHKGSGEDCRVEEVSL